MARPQEHPAHGALHRAGAGQVQKLLARLGSRFPLIVYDASFPGRITRLRFRTFQVCAKDLRAALRQAGGARVMAPGINGATSESTHSTKLPLGVLPWLSRPTWTASMPIPKPSEFSMSRLK